MFTLIPYVLGQGIQYQSILLFRKASSPVFPIDQADCGPIWSSVDQHLVIRPVIFAEMKIDI